MESAVLKIGRQNQVLESNFGRNFIPRFGRDGDFAQLQKGPAEDPAELLEKSFFGDAAFAANEFQERFLGTVGDRHPPRFLPILELLRRGKGGRGQDIL